MKSPGVERSVQQSLLDRLVDHDPRSSSEAPLTWAESVRQLKASLRHDLEWLLNTRRIPSPAPESLEELQRSLYHFGFPDITSLSRDFLPSSWAYYQPTIVDICMFTGSFGLFLSLFLVFCRFMPMIAIAEIKGVMPQAHAAHGNEH